MSKRKPGRKPSSVRLVVEHLEARCLLTYYTLTDLGNLGGEARAQGINSSGQIAGWSYDVFDYQDAVLWDSGGGTHIVDTYAAAYGINDSGQIVGGGGRAGSDAALWDTGSGTTTDLGTLPGGTNSFAWGINSQGQVVGFSDTVDDQGNHHAHAFFWDPTTQVMTDLGTPGPSYPNSYAHGINDAGEVVGSGAPAGEGGPYRAFLWTSATGMIDLLPDSADSTAWAINSAGQVVGTTAEHGPYIWTPDVPNGTTGTAAYLNDCNPNGPRASVPYGINDNGQVVGIAPDFDGAFVWDSTNCTQDLDGLIMPATNFLTDAAYGINDSGQIVGTGGYRGDPYGHAFVLTPIAGPTGRESGPSPFSSLGIGTLLSSLPRSISPADLGALSGPLNREDRGQVHLSENARGIDDGTPRLHSSPSGLSRLGQAMSAASPGHKTSDNPMDLLAARDVVRLD